MNSDTIRMRIKKRKNNNLLKSRQIQKRLTFNHIDEDKFTSLNVSLTGNSATGRESIRFT